MHPGPGTATNASNTVSNELEPDQKAAGIRPIRVSKPAYGWQGTEDGGQGRKT